jgi:hypothetical protein
MGISFKKRGPKYSQQDQDRIRQKLIDAKIIQGLIEAWHGKRELSANQLAIGLKTYDKLVPNLQSQQIEVTEAQPFCVLPAVMPDSKDWETAFQPSSKPETEH